VRIGQSNTVIWRDITQINAPDSVMFSADTPTAEFWMRRQFGAPSVVFDVPADHGKAEAFKEAAEAANFTVVALTKRRSANR
jgi:hypothetical protein